jgi:hypothetical protein
LGKGYREVNKAIVVSLFVLILVGICVSRVKYEVVFLRKSLEGINKEMEKCSDDIKIYSAEWSYLNTPQRLKALCGKYLKNLKPLENNQLISYEQFTQSHFQEDCNRTQEGHNKAFVAFLNGVAKAKDVLEER